MARRRRHVPPSRERYQRANPVVSVRVNAEARQRVDELKQKTGLSLGKLLLQGLDQLERDTGAAFENGRKEGLEEGLRRGHAEGRVTGYAEGTKAAFAQAKKQFRVTYSCVICGGTIDLLPGSEPARIAVDAVRAAGWGHAECHERRRQ